jgi:hypothetical protein
VTPYSTDSKTGSSGSVARLPTVRVKVTWSGGGPAAGGVLVAAGHAHLHVRALVVEQAGRVGLRRLREGVGEGHGHQEGRGQEGEGELHARTSPRSAI